MILLGIESSCDETSAAIVEDGRVVRSNVVASQVPLHERFGGVVPEIASRQHVLAIDMVTQRALDDADVTLDEVHRVAVTYGPGLSGPLLVGIAFAKGLSLSRGMPLFAVNHIEGHILSVWLSQPDESMKDPQLPMVALVVSGGHTELYLIERPGAYHRLGRTKDDAAGEAFDKVGRLLGLPYPGGPSIEVAAKNGKSGVEVSLPRPMLPGTLDFSFSGLKTAVSRIAKQQRNGSEELPPAAVKAIAFEFQESVADVLATKVAQAVASTRARSAALVGGVASNLYLRSRVAESIQVPLYVPGPGLSADNAAMIAGAAYWAPHETDWRLEVQPSLSL